MSDLDRCPKCDGAADNGHDRCIPPNVYWCTKCMTEYFGPDAPRPPVCAHCPLYGGIRCSVCGRWTDEKEEMNREEIIRMARESGLERYHLPDSMMEYEFDRCIERFAALVAAAERERCCGIIFGMAGSDNVAARTVEAIRARGEK